MYQQDTQRLPHGRSGGMASAIILLVIVTGAAGVDRKRLLRHGEEKSLNGTESQASLSSALVASQDVVSKLRPLWPLTTVVLTAKELEPSGRMQHLRQQLESLAVPFRVEDGDYAGRYGSLLEQFDELSLEPHVRSAWVAGRAQNDLLEQDLIGNADAFCDVDACLKQSHCVCVNDTKALPADSLLSISTTHRRAWQSIADDAERGDDSWHLLLEDDAELLPKNFTGYFQGFTVPAEADLVWLYRGTYQHRCWPEKDEENVLMSGPVFNTSDYNGVAYAITKAGARRLLRHVPQDGTPVDMAMSRAVGSCALKAYCPPSGRYPVSDSRFQADTTRLALTQDNLALDDRPSKPSSFLQLTATGHAASLHHEPPQPPRRRVQCSSNARDE